MPTRIDNHRDIMSGRYSSPIGGRRDVERRCGNCANPCSAFSLSPLHESLVQIGMYKMGCNCRESIGGDVNGSKGGSR